MWKIDATDDGILPSLRLSYNHLPQRLKQCFSLCSLYPKDYSCFSYQLIMLWMAHGLLQPTNEEEEPEQIGESYIKKLLSASFLQLDDDFSENEIPIYTSVGFCMLKMHDLAKSTMKESNKTRTIIARQTARESPVEWTSNEFEHLKVLDFEEIKLLPDDCFAKVKHLRYLRVCNCDMLEKLPGSICKLQILQSLDLSHCYNLLELPKSMKNLVSLRVLFLTPIATSLSFMDTGNFQQLQCLFIITCKNLVSLPNALGHLTALKKLVVSGCTQLVNFEDEEEEEKKHVIVHDLNLEAFLILRSSELNALPKWLKRSIKALRYMSIVDTRIEALPEWLPGATSLEHLYINDCQHLSSLPDK